MNNLVKFAITTSQNRQHLIDIAQIISKEIKAKYIPRVNLSLKHIKNEYNLDHLLVVREDKVVIDDKYFFHPGMSIPRIKVLKKGEVDPMLEAMDIGPGDSVLDCTLGMANDAIVASFIVGEKGLVLGLESSPIIFIVTKWGLRFYKRGSKDSQKAMGNIKVINTDYELMLDNLPDNSMDVIYFDPMFDIPLIRSSGIKGLRDFANYGKLTQVALEKALRVAKRRVVIKDRKNGNVFKEFQVDKVYGGRYSNIKYGVLIK